ncbi:MAG TPA: hypothetical protein VKB51_12395 [bacterium]|nr:hypothetical protein [bacterium]
MNTTKRIALSALAVGLFLALAAVPAAWSDVTSDDSAQAAQQELTQHMWQMRNIMHFGVFTAQPTDKGVTVTVTSQDPAIVTAIQNEFTGEHAALGSPVPDSSVSATKTDAGAALAFTSDDEAVVKTLQGYGATLGYGLLRTNMYATMVALRATNGAGNGPGWGMRGGYGPGWMHGPQGYGPGGMHGWMHGPQGYGPGWGGGMMGPGYGPSGQQPPAGKP